MCAGRTELSRSSHDNLTLPRFLVILCILLGFRALHQHKAAHDCEPKVKRIISKYFTDTIVKWHTFRIVFAVRSCKKTTTISEVPVLARHQLRTYWLDLMIFQQSTLTFVIVMTQNGNQPVWRGRPSYLQRAALWRSRSVA